MTLKQRNAGRACLRNEMKFITKLIHYYRKNENSQIVHQKISQRAVGLRMQNAVEVQRQS